MLIVVLQGVKGLKKFPYTTHSHILIEAADSRLIHPVHRLALISVLSPQWHPVDTSMYITLAPIFQAQKGLHYCSR
jgi:hypothetical protein